MHIAWSATSPTPTETPLRLARLRQYLSVDPGNLPLRCEAIAAAIETGAVADAEQWLQEGWVSTPQAGELFALAGRLSLYQQDYSLALQHLKQAFHLGCDQPGIRYNLAFALFYLGEHQVALDELNSFIPDPEFAIQTNLLAARCLHHLERAELAIARLQALPEHNEDSAGLLALLMYDTDHADEAIETASQVLVNQPEQLDALLARASALFEKEQFEAAQQDYALATAKHPHCGRAWLGMAQLSFRDFKFDEAKLAAQQAVTHMAKHIGSWHLLAWTHIQRGDTAAAKLAFEQAYALDRNFGETHGGLAVVAAIEGHVKLAQEHVKRAVKLNPSGFAAIYAQMLLLRQQGKQQEAQALLERVMQTPQANMNQLPKDLVLQRIRNMPSLPVKGQ